MLDAHNTQPEDPVRCLASTGHLFATILSIVYLIPLIVLCVRFYNRSYFTTLATPSRPRTM